MANVMVGSARIDERGKLSGGQAGDQTTKEVAYQNWYLHKKGWTLIRAKDSNVANKIGDAMKAACDNNNIGYDQSNRNGLYKNVFNLGFNPAKCSVKTEVDCSALVRVCVLYAGITVGDFNTAAEVNALKSTGKFDIINDSKYTTSSKYLKKGDILVTKTKGHTVVVLNDGEGVSSIDLSTPPQTTNKVPIATPTLRKGMRNNNVAILQADLNFIMGSKLDLDGDFGPATDRVLRDFQKKYKIGVDGVYGNQSFNKMKEVIG